MIFDFVDTVASLLVGNLDVGVVPGDPNTLDDGAVRLVASAFDLVGTYT